VVKKKANNLQLSGKYFPAKQQQRTPRIRTKDKIYTPNRTKKANVGQKQNIHYFKTSVSH
jgi:hypothetical protein